MNYNELMLRQPKLPRKQFSESQTIPDRPVLRLENHRLSEPRAKINLIKINKNKLPVDFFPKKEASSRRTSQQRIYFPQEFTEPVLRQKADSERLHFSPEKTSFFGFFEERENQQLRVSGGNKFFNRKFETRDQPKRDAFPVDPSRKLTTASKPVKNELLDLFPSTYDQQLTDIIISSSKTHNLRLSPRKEPLNRHKEDLADPQKKEESRGEGAKKGSMIRMKDVSMSQKVQSEMLNITFYNAKSSCFPPINRHV